VQVSVVVRATGCDAVTLLSGVKPCAVVEVEEHLADGLLFSTSFGGAPVSADPAEHARLIVGRYYLASIGSIPNIATGGFYRVSPPSFNRLVHHLKSNHEGHEC
jgi:hypothetical protein